MAVADPAGRQEPALPIFGGAAAEGPHVDRYAVNVIVDNGNAQGAPVVTENNPSYQNLVGRVEHIAQFGALVTDFTLIKPGALHRANGGYLLLDVRKVLMQPLAWEQLKRALRSREVRIESLSSAYWSQRFNGARRVAPLDPNQSNASYSR